MFRTNEANQLNKYWELEFNLIEKNIFEPIEWKFEQSDKDYCRSNFYTY